MVTKYELFLDHFGFSLGVFSWTSFTCFSFFSHFLSSLFLSPVLPALPSQKSWVSSLELSAAVKPRLKQASKNGVGEGSLCHCLLCTLEGADVGGMFSIGMQMLGQHPLTLPQ